MKEIWKDIPGFENKYQASNLGRIKSLKDNHNKLRKKILFQASDQKGYLHVCLHIKNKGKTYRVSRIIAKLFIPNPENKPQVNHKDGNKKNNNVANLEWNTGSENIKHAFANNLRTIQGENHPLHKLTKFDIEKIRNLNRDKTNWTQKKISEVFNVHPSTISNICNYRLWKNL
jgi:DNA gyrase/topoisomerase IV subunit B